MTHATTMLTRTALTALLILPVPSCAAEPLWTRPISVHQTEDAIKQAEQRASSVRESSSADWRAGNYAAAARKLEEAVQI